MTSECDMPNDVWKHLDDEEDGCQCSADANARCGAGDDAPGKIEHSPAAEQDQDGAKDGAEPPRANDQPADEITGVVMAKIQHFHFGVVAGLNDVGGKCAVTANENRLPGKLQPTSGF